MFLFSNRLKGQNYGEKQKAVFESMVVVLNADGKAMNRMAVFSIWT